MKETSDQLQEAGRNLAVALGSIAYIYPGWFGSLSMTPIGLLILEFVLAGSLICSCWLTSNAVEEEIYWEDEVAFRYSVATVEMLKIVWTVVSYTLISLVAVVAVSALTAHASVSTSGAIFLTMYRIKSYVHYRDAIDLAIVTKGLEKKDYYAYQEWSRGYGISINKSQRKWDGRFAFYVEDAKIEADPTYSYYFNRHWQISNKSGITRIQDLPPFDPADR
jgi:hypothetical protein